MQVDKQATKQAPKGWTIWTTGHLWQAVHDLATEQNELWYPMRKSAKEALLDLQPRPWNAAVEFWCAKCGSEVWEGLEWCKHCDHPTGLIGSLEQARQEKTMADESHDEAARRAVEAIIHREGVLGATVEPIDPRAKYGFSSYINEYRAAPHIDGWVLLECHRLGLSLLRKYPNAKSIVIGDVRIRLMRWNQLMVAATSIKSHAINKSMSRIIRRAGETCDRPDPDDTRLGKELGQLERSNPEIAKAAENYDKMVESVIGRKPG